MRHFTLLKTWLAMLLLLVGVSTSWAEGKYVKVTSAPSDWCGDYLIVYEAGNVAFDGSLTTLDAVSNTQAVTISDGVIEATDAMNAIRFTVAQKTESTAYYSLKSASGKYISGTNATTNASNGLKTADVDTNYEITFGIESDNAVVYSKSADQKMTLRYNKASNQARFRFYKTGQEAISLYKYVGSAITDPETPTDPDPETPEVKEYASLADLVAAGAPTTAGVDVKVTLKDIEITGINKSRTGVFTKVGDQEVEIFCKGVPADEAWVIGGKVSGTLTCPWMLYNTTWELCPEDWSGLTYTAPENPIVDVIPNFIKTATLTLTAGDEAYDVRKCLNIPSDVDYDKYAITTSVDGQTSKEDEFACVYPWLSFKKAGTYTVTVKAPAVDGKYAETTGTITVTVKEPVVVPEIPTDAAEMSIADFIAAEGSTEGVYLIGTVGKIDNATYGNFDLTDESGTIYIYGCLTPEGQKQQFATLGVAEGDKIKVFATEYKLFNSTKEAVNVVFVEKMESEQPGTDEPVGDELTVTFGDLGFKSWGKDANFSGTTFDEVSQEKDGVTFTYTRNTGSCYANNSAIRFYKANELTFTAPAGYNIVEVNWTGSGFKDDVTADEPTCTSTTDALSWKGEAPYVVFTRPKDASSYMTLSAVSVKLAKDNATSGTLQLVAQNEDGYWATFSAKKGVFFKLADANVYTVTVEGEKVVTTLLSNNSYVTTAASYGYYVPAGTGVLINSSNATVTYYMSEGSDLDELVPVTADNLLRPATEAMTGDNKFYRLAYDDYSAKTGLGFYYGAADGAAFSCKAGSAYLAVPASQAVKGFKLMSDEDAIKSVEMAEQDAIYDLQGRKVSMAQKGLYIVNGKKVVR